MSHNGLKFPYKRMGNIAQIIFAVPIRCQHLTRDSRRMPSKLIHPNYSQPSFETCRRIIAWDGLLPATRLDWKGTKNVTKFSCLITQWKLLWNSLVGLSSFEIHQRVRTVNYSNDSPNDESSHLLTETLL